MTISSLKKKLWKLVAAWIKHRDKNRCKSCGTVARGMGYHAGHLIPRSVCGVYLYFSPRNLYGQCARCNLWAGGNGALLAKRVSDELGTDIVSELETARKRTNGMQWDKKKLQALIKVLQNGDDYAKQYDEIML